MKKIICTVTEDDESGNIGLLPDKFKEWFDKGKYTLEFRLSHELLEHGNHETGSLENELKAFGVRLWVSNFLRSFNSFGIFSKEKIFASDLAMSVDESFEIGGFCYPHVEKKRFRKFEDLEELQDFFNATWLEVEKKLLSDYYLLLSEHEDNPEQAVLDYLASIKDAVFSHIAAGYSHAEKVRYKDYDCYDVFSFGKRLDESLRNIENKVEVGDRVIIRYCLKKSLIRVDIFEQFED